MAFSSNQQVERRKIEAITLGDFTSERVIRFLRHLETERHNGIATRNARLAGLHTLSRFLIAHYPEHMATFQSVLGIPFKRGMQKLPVDYLEIAEVEALLGGINQRLKEIRRAHCRKDTAVVPATVKWRFSALRTIFFRLDPRDSPPCTEALMNLDLVIAALEDPSEKAIGALLDEDQAVFWVDWRHDDHAIPNDCESVLQTGQLSGEMVKVDTDPGFEIYVRYKDKRIKVPLTIGTADRHITICSLNEALTPDYEVRFCIDSNGSDTLAFLPLATSTWAELEERYGERVSKRFYKIAPRPNLFTEVLDF